jgi:hypothetical protein
MPPGAGLAFPRRPGRCGRGAHQLWRPGD